MADSGYSGKNQTGQKRRQSPGGNQWDPAVSAEDASAVLALLERLQGMGIEPPDKMKKQATMLVRRCMMLTKA